ncbi:subtilisin-like protein [Mycena amicta]|nr:subtilisin-like protein [Mycena amicta]
MFFSGLLSTLSIALAVSASNLVLHEERKATPPGFKSVGRVPDNHMLTLRFGLASNNIAGLQDKLLSISTPGSSEFRQWLSQDEIKSFVAPSADTLNAVNSFASANGLKTSANKLFGATFTNFTHANLTNPITRTLSISLPSELAGHVDVVHPSTAFTTPKARRGRSFRFDIPKRKRDATAPANCDTSDPNNSITPACLQALYNIPTTPATQQNNALLVTGYGLQWAEIADLQTFMKQFRPDLPSGANQTFLTFTIDGGINPQFPDAAGLEAQLDIEYTAGIASEVPLQFLSVGGGVDLGTGFLDTTSFLASAQQPPTVVTTSYADNESNFGASLTRKICDGYAAATARGISLLYASGDGGVNGNHDAASGCGLFIPVFPGTCPYVTALRNLICSIEVAINFTGGMFSNIFPQPSYQSDAVAKFLQTLPADFPGHFNHTGRGYPDVSLQGWNFLVGVDDSIIEVGGTSASSPTVAAMVALVNDQLLAAGKPVLGFLNPFLYANPSVFNDITMGHNSGFACSEDTAAFDAIEGWDPLSGLGTPDFLRLLAAALG